MSTTLEGRTVEEQVMLLQRSGQDEAARRLHAFMRDSVIRVVLFHGTKADVHTFDRTKAGVSDIGLVGKAFYFTPTAEQAGGFALSPHYGRHKGADAPNVMPVWVVARRPYWLAADQMQQLPGFGGSLADLVQRRDTGKFQAWLRRKGYDSVCFTIGTELTQVAVWRAEQVKSAIGNFGFYDPQGRNVTEHSEGDAIRAQRLLRSLEEVSQHYVVNT